MEKAVLEMDFKDDGNKVITIKVESPKKNLDKATIFAAMDKIIAGNVFQTKEGIVKSKGNARIVKTQVEEFE